MAYSESVRKKRLDNERADLQACIIPFEERHICGAITFLFKEHTPIPFTIMLGQDYPFDPPSISFTLSQSFFCQLDLQQSQHITELMPEWGVHMRLSNVAELMPAKIESLIRNRDQLPACLLYDFLSVHACVMVFLLSLLFRMLVGLGGYSGFNDPPLYGDYQAQRNWMALTNSRPVQFWYTETNPNPWWRLDYPPLSGYHAYVFGLLSQYLIPGSLGYQGFQSTSHKAFMRMAAILSDMLLIFGGLLIFEGKMNGGCKRMVLLISLCSPLVMLIDHGHCQFNNVVGGMLWLSIYFMLDHHLTLAAVIYTLSLNFKQTALFYSLPIFGYYVGCLLLRSKLINKAKQLCYPATAAVFSFFYHCCFFGLIVATVTALLWIPWATAGNISQVLNAIFPLQRGLYQLKVANFWCTLDPLFKWSNWLSNSELVKISAILTIIFSMPSVYWLVLFPVRKMLFHALLNSSLAAFMFGFHMHEKTVLIPLYAGLLCSWQMGRWSVDLSLVCVFANYHLLKEDGLTLQYFCIVPLYYLLSRQAMNFLEKTEIVPTNSNYAGLLGWAAFLHDNIVMPIAILAIVILHLLDCWVNPPQNLPFLWNLLFSGVSFVVLMSIGVLSNLMMAGQFESKWQELVREQNQKSA